jgi:hypothetical protein
LQIGVVTVGYAAKVAVGYAAKVTVGYAAKVTVGYAAKVTVGYAAKVTVGYAAKAGIVAVLQVGGSGVRIPAEARNVPFLGNFQTGSVANQPAIQLVKVKVKQSHYRPGQALRVPGG